MMVVFPMLCEATNYTVQWDMDFESSYLRSLSVDVDNNLYFSYWNDDEYIYYFSKITEDGVELYDRTLNPEPNNYAYRMDDSGNYYFISIGDKVSEINVLGKEFTIAKYSNNLIYESTSVLNLSNHFEGNFTGNLYYVDSECAYFAIWEYQTEYTDLDSIQLAKYNIEGERLWNRTIAKNPERTIFGFCKNIHGNVFVENENVLYYLDDENGEAIWERTIIIEDPTVEVDNQNIIAYQENVLLVAFTLDHRLLLKLCRLDNNTGWEYIIDKEIISSWTSISSVAVEGEYLGIITSEENYVYDDKEKTTLFHLRLLNIGKDVLYTERVEIVDEDETGSDIRRNMRLYPTNDGHFYLYEYFEDRLNDIEENTIKYCIPRTNLTPGYTITTVFTSVSFLVLTIIIRRKRKR